MKQTPIIFQPEMIRALLDGAKTQMRLIIKPQPDDDAKITIGEIGTSRGIAYIGNSRSGGIVTRVPCPYGKPGDLLWVRETFSPCLKNSVVYKADGQGVGEFGIDEIIWKSPRFMPRKYSRLTLKITDIRVERVQDISEHDAIAEGVTLLQSCTSGYLPLVDNINNAYIRGYANLWNKINGVESWNQNPWVWAIKFDVIKQNIDEYIDEYIGK